MGLTNHVESEEFMAERLRQIQVQQEARSQEFKRKTEEVEELRQEYLRQQSELEKEYFDTKQKQNVKDV